jgi:hypothetical protein
MPLTRPEPLAEIHELNDFFSGVTSLDDWLRARANQVSGGMAAAVVEALDRLREFLSERYARPDTNSLGASMCMRSVPYGQ